LSRIYGCVRLCPRVGQCLSLPLLPLRSLLLGKDQRGRQTWRPRLFRAWGERGEESPSVLPGLGISITYDLPLAANHPDSRDRCGSPAWIGQAEASHDELTIPSFRVRTRRGLA
jgi:hypothetical protein